MKNKKLMLATTALAIVSLHAPASAGEMYVSVFGGVNWSDDADGFHFRSSNPTNTAEYFTISQYANAESGFVVGGAIGSSLNNWVQGLSVELEASYRRNDYNGAVRFFLTETDTITIGALDTFSLGGRTSSTLSTFALMANVWYEHDMGWNVRPYVGGGIGWGRARLDHAGFLTGATTTATAAELSNEGLAWQVGVGFKYEAAPGIDIGLGYRYFEGPEIQNPFFFGKLGDGSGVFDNNSHSVSATLSVAIN